MDPNSHDRSAGEAGNSLRASIHAKPDYEYVARQHSDRAAAKFPRGERLWRALDGRSFHAAELLEKRGYQTAAFIGSIILDSKTLAPGLDRGFEFYDNFPEK